MKKSNPVDLIMAMMREVNSNEHRVSIPTLYIKIFNGDVTTALIAQECEYYSGINENKDGWFYMRQEDWATRYCLSRRDVDRAVQKMQATGGLVDAKIKKAPDGNTAKYYRFNHRRMFGRIYNYMRSQNLAADIIDKARELGFAIGGKSTRIAKNVQSPPPPDCTKRANRSVQH